MTLSQIIARSPKYDEEISIDGHFAVRVEIQNGKVVYAEVTKKIKDLEEELHQHKKHLAI